jgi:crotonobetainyl-CoA:carnitine CoA-transferase CaiB-like acyl-CoA transferase
LDGIRVVDFGHYIAGPLLAVMLADQGAEVIHIDRPGARADDEEPKYAFLHRGKRRIALDLKSTEGQQRALALIRGADVVVENFRPGVMDRLGLGWAQVSKVAPRVVYCSLPGFGADDPRAAVPGWEGVIAAATGNCRIRAGEEPEGWDTSRPTYAPVPSASNFAAFLGAFGVVTALTARESTGRGQHVDIPLYNAVFESIGAAGAYINRKGLPPQRPLTGNGSGTYQCADGRYIQFNPIGSSTRFLRWFLSAAGRPDWAAEVAAARTGSAIDWTQRLQELLSTRPAQEWEDIANSVGAPLCLIRTGEEWLHTPHARASQQVVQLEDPLLGPTWMAGLPVRVDGHVHLPGPRRLADADRSEISAQADATPAPEPAGESGPTPDVLPYNGLRVVDLTQILAGPSSARLLGEFGADVLKINNPKRSVAAHAVVNRGKRSILLNVEADAGREVLWRLLDDADVFVQNFPTGTADRYGLGYEHLKAHRPGIVYVSVSCYGSIGPWRERRGYETQGQAVSGIMERAGGEYEPEVAGPYNILDYGTGVLAGYAAALGLFHRARTGEGTHVQAALSATGSLHQASYLLSPESGSVPEWIAGPQTLGLGALQRFYECSDGWLFIGARADQAELVADILGVSVQADDEAFTAAIEAALADGTAADWSDRLQKAGVGAHRLVELAELMDDPWARARGLSVTQVSDEAGEVTMPGISVSLSASQPKLERISRRPGADGPAVLTEFGLGDQIERLTQAWILQVDDLPTVWDRM